MAWTYNTSEAEATIGPRVAGIAIGFSCLSMLVTLLRAYVRIRLIKAVGADDWAIFITWFLAAGFEVVTYFQTRWGLGLQDVAEMPAENIYTFGLLQYIRTTFYLMSILGFKLSLLLSYLRFMPLGAWRKATIGVMIVTTVFHVAVLMIQFKLCQPIAKQWDPTITWGKCLPAVPFYTTMGALIMLNDLAILAMNLVSLTMQFPVLSMTQIPRRQKAVLLGLFALGLFITIIQIFRIQTVKNLVNYVNSATLVMWCTIENNLAIVVICNPPLRPLVKYFAGKSSSARRSAGNGSMVAGKNGLRFELQAWRTAKAGLYPLGSGVDRISESHIGAGGSGDISSSRDFTLDRSAIVKRTEITTFSSEC